MQLEREILEEAKRVKAHMTQGREKCRCMSANNFAYPSSIPSPPILPHRAFRRLSWQEHCCNCPTFCPDPPFHTQCARQSNEVDGNFLDIAYPPKAAGCLEPKIIGKQNQAKGINDLITSFHLVPFLTAGFAHLPSQTGLKELTDPMDSFHSSPGLMSHGGYKLRSNQPEVGDSEMCEDQSRWVIGQKCVMHVTVVLRDHFGRDSWLVCPPLLGFWGAVLHCSAVLLCD